MRIERISLKNYRCFAELTVDLHPNLTVLVAPNGQGKTTLLDAIKVALWPYVAGFDLGSSTNDITGIHIDDVRREQTQSHEMESQLPAEINASGQINVLKLISEGALKHPSSGELFDLAKLSAVPWQSLRRRESIGKNTRTKDMPQKDALNIKVVAKALQKRIFSGEQKSRDVLPILAYYGTGRLWRQNKRTDEKAGSESLSRTFAYRDCLDSSSNYKHFAQWFSRVHLSYLQAQIRNLTNGLPPDADMPSAIQAPVRVVQRAVDAILKAHTGWHTLEYNPEEENEDLLLNHPEHGSLRVSQLSDGIRTMLGLVGDIAYRCYKLNAHFYEYALFHTPGIVLIDEIDMHLHPAWQQTILPDLRKVFPEIQFIVTTHSPQVLSTIQREHIRVIGVNREGKIIAEPPLAMTYGEPSGDVMHSVMMVDPQPPVDEKKELLQLTELVDQGYYTTEEAQRLMQELTDKLGEQHPQLQRLQRSIKRQEALQQ